MGTNTSNNNKQTKKDLDPMLSNLPKATVGGGCFWCVEAVFQRLQGVKAVESGYTGGQVDNPTYEQVCSGKTGHAEVLQITFDAEKLTYKDLLKVFFLTHDPTTLNRQGNDAGTQYRSVIYYHDDNQKTIAEEMIKEITEAKYYKDPIVTEVSSLGKYYPAEDYHQNYYNLNGSTNGYCQYVVKSKVDKFMKIFKDKSQPSL
jgi:peptide-methionine (S)-S-oxide reductase